MGGWVSFYTMTPLPSLLSYMWVTALHSVSLARATPVREKMGPYFYCMSMLDVRHLHAVIKDTVRDESFLVSPILLKSAESWQDIT